ncbi:unnamed protein product, partial [Polarella glacialis]
YCIFKFGSSASPRTLFRGVDLADLDLHEMFKLRKFYIPSFVSTSRSWPSEAWPVILIVDASEASSVLEITRDLSKSFAASSKLQPRQCDEGEALLPCYSMFELQQIDMYSRPKVVKLKVLPHTAYQSVTCMAPGGFVCGDTVKTTSEATMRSEELLQSDIVAMLPPGTPLTILRVGGNRVQVKVRDSPQSGAVGWISVRVDWGMLLEAAE